jgi:hypothetical protein
MNIVLEVANRAMQYRQRASEIWYRENSEGELAPEYKTLDSFLTQFEAGSQLLELMVIDNLRELAEKVFGDIITQNFVLDLQYYVFSIYPAEDVKELVRRLAFGLCLQRTPNYETPAESVAPDDNTAYSLTEADVQAVLTANFWVVGLLLLPLAQGTEVPQNGTNSPASVS